MAREALDIIAITGIAVAIGEGQDIKTLEVLAAYFFLLGSTLKSLAATRALEENQNKSKI